ncbi:hypothetical protein V1514DRAFT_332413 [Lipomyces japonicus]|uniref:uncharacterized protein n=1 Tax=Lipomyces japonicus TaxID=56871 RepID=UPI0034CDDDC8
MSQVSSELDLDATINTDDSSGTISTLSHEFIESQTTIDQESSVNLDKKVTHERGRDSDTDERERDEEPHDASDETDHEHDDLNEQHTNSVDNEIIGSGSRSQKSEAREAVAKAASKFKENRSNPVAVIRTEGVQAQINQLIDELNERVKNESKEIADRMDLLLRKIDELERKIKT